MATLQEEAAVAFAAYQAAQEAEREAKRAAMQADARAAVRAVLIRPDGTQISLTEVGLTFDHVSLEERRAVWRTSDVALAAVKRDGAWSVHLARNDGGAWVMVSEPLRALADLHQALQAAD